MVVRTFLAVMACLLLAAYFTPSAQVNCGNTLDSTLCVSKIDSATAAQFDQTGVSPFWATLHADSAYLQPSTNCDTSYCGFVGGALDASMTVKAACTNVGVYLYFAVQDNVFVDWDGYSYAGDGVQLYLDGQDAHAVWTDSNTIGPYQSDFSESSQQIGVYMGGSVAPTGFRFSWDDLRSQWTANNVFSFAEANAKYGFRVKITTLDATHKTQECFVPWTLYGGGLSGFDAFTAGDTIGGKLVAFAAGYVDIDSAGQTTWAQIDWPNRGDPWDFPRDWKNYWGNLLIPDGTVVVAAPSGVVKRAVGRTERSALSNTYYTLQGRRLTVETANKLPVGGLVVKRSSFADGSQQSIVVREGW